jgi:hypothetical protein
MAENNHTKMQMLTAFEIESLADHLAARAVSRLTDDQPHLRQRLILAAALLRVLATEHPDGLSVEVFIQGGR